MTQQSVDAESEGQGALIPCALSLLLWKLSLSYLLCDGCVGHKVVGGTWARKLSRAAARGVEREQPRRVKRRRCARRPGIRLSQLVETYRSQTIDPMPMRPACLALHLKIFEVSTVM